MLENWEDEVAKSQVWSADLIWLTGVPYHALIDAIWETHRMLLITIDEKYMSYLKKKFKEPPLQPVPLIALPSFIKKTI